VNIIEIVQPIFVLAMIVGIGFFISKKVEVTKETRQFITFTVINIAIPCVIIQSIFQSEIDRSMWMNFGIIFLCGLILNLTGLLFGYITGRSFKYSIPESKQMAILSGCGNTAFFGIPIAYMLFGSTAGLYASIYDTATVFTVFTAGITLLSGGKFSFANFKHFINTPIITLVISLSIAYNGIGIPPLVFELSSLLSSLAAPLAMIYTGMLFQEITAEKWLKVKNSYVPYMASSTAIKLLVLPILAFMIVYIIKIEASIGGIIILQAGMPTFLVAAVLFSRYTQSEDQGVVNIIITTSLSLITIPLLIIVFISNL
jgi:hypothetical protein